MKTPIESREENEDWLWRQQYAKETLRIIPDDVKLENVIGIAFWTVIDVCKSTTCAKCKKFSRIEPDKTQLLERNV